MLDRRVGIIRYKSHQHELGAGHADVCAKMLSVSKHHSGQAVEAVNEFSQHTFGLSVGETLKRCAGWWDSVLTGRIGPWACPRSAIWHRLDDLSCLANH